MRNIFIIFFMKTVLAFEELEGKREIFFLKMTIFTNVKNVYTLLKYPPLLNIHVAPLFVAIN